jgi:hypothetical protein
MPGVLLPGPGLLMLQVPGPPLWTQVREQVPTRAGKISRHNVIKPG